MSNIKFVESDALGTRTISNVPIGDIFIDNHHDRRPYMVISVPQALTTEGVTWAVDLTTGTLVKFDNTKQVWPAINAGITYSTGRRD